MTYSPHSGMPPARVRALLGRLPLFGGLWNDELDRVLTICEPRRAAIGETIFAEGDASDCMFVVLGGAVEIRTQKNGKLYVTRPGDNFGEIGMISQRKRTASAIAVEDSQLLRLHRDDFNRLLGQAPRINALILRNITEYLSQHLVRMNNRLTTEYLPPKTRQQAPADGSDG